MSATGGLGRLLRRLTTTADELEAERLRLEVESCGAQPIAGAPLRTPVTLRGSIASITINPRGGTRWLEAVLRDGSGEVTLVWMGRRTIRGIDAGRRLEVDGMITLHEGRRTVFNPRYSLLEN